MHYIEFILYVLLLGYGLLIVYFLIGWLKIPKRNSAVKSDEYNSFTVIISARNEAHCIGKNLQNLFQQTYPLQFFEVIIINDHSTDNTLEVLHLFQSEYQQYPIRIIDLSQYPAVSNKKQAITLGVEMASYNWIILTDADCIRHHNWLQSVNNFIAQHSAVQLIYAPVVLQANNWFEKLQSLEFSGLLGIGAASIQMGRPNMCSAANLVFKKKVFEQVNGYQGNQHIASGDDEFLMHKIHKQFPGTLAFLKDSESIVSTSSAPTLNDFIEQRKRWVSKSTKYENKGITLILVGAYLLNLLILLFILLLVIDLHYAVIGIGVLLIKTIIEGVFLYRVLKFFRIESYIWLLPLAAPLHVIYVVVIGLLANSKSYQWKGRIH